MNRFDTVSPMDYRYYGGDPAFEARLKPYLSEEGYVAYCLKVEVALARALAQLGLCSAAAADEIAEAATRVRALDVYKEERRTEHATAALANCLRGLVSKESRPFVHLFATSSDISDTANALRFKDFIRDVLGLDLVALGKSLMNLATQEKATVQVGRTHGVHAEPVTFGYSIALYLDRLGQRLVSLESARLNLRGKLSGAVGTYAAAGLAFPADPTIVESTTLKLLGLSPAPNRVSSQIVQQEYVVDLMHILTSTFSILAQIADDFRNLHRSEIAELSLQHSESYIGSSTMPHKANPAGLENIKSLWKAFAPRMVSVYLDQVSEHQRDLTNSASSRFLPELLAALDYAVTRLSRMISNIRVQRETMLTNLKQSAADLIAEPLYVCLALNGHPEASQAVRTAIESATLAGKPLLTIAKSDSALAPYLSHLTEDQLAILEDVRTYTGNAIQLTEEVSSWWAQAFEEMKAAWLLEASGMLG